MTCQQRWLCGPEADRTCWVCKPAPEPKCHKCGDDGCCWLCWGEDGYNARPLDPDDNPKALDRRDEDYT